MIGLFTRLPDPNTQDEFNLLVQASNAVEAKLRELKSSVDNLRIPTMKEIQSNLQQGGSNPLNLTGLQGRGGT